MTLGIDIGTSKTAAVITDGDKLLASASRVHLAERDSAPGQLEQGVKGLLRSAYQVVQDLPAEARQGVRAVGVTGQMHGVTVLDAGGEALTPLFTWQDERCDPAFLAELKSRTGMRLATGWGCATLAWLARNGRMPAAASTAGTIMDVLVARLCGLGRLVMDPTNAASWGLFNLDTLNWNGPAVRSAGILASLLPDIRPCGSRAGALQADAAGELGLPSGVPVAVAIGDNQASMLATLDDPERQLSITLGTGGQLSAVLPALPADPRLLERYEYRPYPGNRVALVGASLCGGAAWEWLADSVEAMLRDMGHTIASRQDTYDRINRLGAAALAKSPSLIVFPHFAGERHNPELRGSISGIDRANFTVGQLAAALAEGIMRNLAGLVPPELLTSRAELVASGNALRKNPLLQQAASRVLALPLKISAAQEEAAVGAARNAARLLN